MVVEVKERTQRARHREGERERREQSVGYKTYTPLNNCECHSLPAKVQLQYLFYTRTAFSSLI